MSLQDPKQTILNKISGSNHFSLPKTVQDPYVRGSMYIFLCTYRRQDCFKVVFPNIVPSHMYPMAESHMYPMAELGFKVVSIANTNRVIKLPPTTRLTELNILPQNTGLHIYIHDIQKEADLPANQESVVVITVDLEFDCQIQTANEMGKWVFFGWKKMKSGFDFDQNGI